MKAAVFEAFRGPIEIREVEEPSPPPGGVVLRIEANGICRSDWHGWMGHDDEIALPHVPGHEMAGTVVAKAHGVNGFDVGDRVTVPFVLGCGVCRECASGNQQICDRQYQPGFSGWGAFSEYVPLPHAEGNLVRLPDSMSFVEAAGLGCRFSTAYRAVVDQGGVGEGTTVAVWGCGGVGLSAVMIASSLGATVVAIDIDEAALQLAKRFGATHVVLSTEDSDDADIVQDLLDGGAEVSIDALGSVKTAVSGILSLRKRGRYVQVGLMIGPAEKPAIPMWQLHAKEVEMVGVHGMAAWQYPAMFDMITDGRLTPLDLVTETVGLRRGAAHLESMHDYPGNGFVVITDFSGDL
ncbi:MAG: zinc-dependent alcohol dehydrogenase family protein [Actinomycetota bacterium]